MVFGRKTGKKLTAERYIRISTTKALNPALPLNPELYDLLWCYLSHSAQGFPHIHAHTSSLPKHFQYESRCNKKKFRHKIDFLATPGSGSGGLAAGFKVQRKLSQTVRSTH
jgi:hypothetical protein